MNQQDMLKQQIVDVVLRAGIAIGAKNIADCVAIPKGVAMKTLLNELLNERRLVTRYTLQVNGKRIRLYNVPPNMYTPQDIHQ